MKRCPLHNTWHPNQYRFCPDCGQELERNEVSSEDGDDGVFADVKRCAECGKTITDTSGASSVVSDGRWRLLCDDCFDIMVNEHIAAKRLARVKAKMERSEIGRIREALDKRKGETKCQ